MNFVMNLDLILSNEIIFTKIDNRYRQNECSVREIAVQAEKSDVFDSWILFKPTNIRIDCHVSDVTF